MAQIETVLFIPLADNEGLPFSQPDWNQLHARLALAGNGSTRRGPHAGSWLGSDGILYSEPVFEFEVAIESWFALPVFLETVTWAQGHFRQLAMHFKVAGIHENYPR